MHVTSYVGANVNDTRLYYSNLYKFNFLGDVPSPPDAVRLQKSESGQDGESWLAWWGESEPNGSPILAYELQMALQDEDFNEASDNLTFITVYNDTGNRFF